MNKKLCCLYVLASLVLTLLSGCVSPAGDGFPATTEGQVAVTATIAGVEHQDVTDARIILSRGKHVFQWDVPVDGLDISAELQVPIGIWDLTILLLDSEGTVQYQSAPQPVEVLPNGAQLVEVVLRPGDGFVNLWIELGDSPFWQNVSRARVYFNDERTELIWEGEEGPINHTFSLPPGTYDLLIELYTESFHAVNRIAPGLWQAIEVKPTEELVIRWQPAEQTLVVNAVIHLIPEAPQNVTAHCADGLVRLSWDPHPNPFVTGYFVYVQTDPLERPYLLTPEPITGHEYVHDLAELGALSAAYASYSVSAAGHTGPAGYRSAPVFVELSP